MAVVGDCASSSSLFVLLEGHTADENNELTLAQGDRVLAEHTIPNGWWYCKSWNDNVHGWLPSTLLGDATTPGFAGPVCDVLQLSKEQSMLTARASATETFLIEEDDFIAFLNRAEHHHRQAFRSMDWLNDTDEKAFLQPLQRAVHIEQEVARQLQSSTLGPPSDSCPITAVLLSHALELLHVYTSIAAKGPATIKRFQALISSSSKLRGRLSTEDQPLLPSVLQSILKHVETYHDAYFFLRMCTPQSHPDASRVKTCAAFLMQLMQAVDSVEYLKTAEEALRRASIEAWQGPALDKCGQLLLTSKVKASTNGSGAGKDDEVHLLLLFEQRIILVVVGTTAVPQPKGKQYRLVRSMPIEHEGTPTLRQQHGCCCVLRGFHGWDRTSLHLQFPSSQDAALWEGLITTWRAKTYNKGVEGLPSWPASSCTRGMDIEPVEETSAGLSARAAGIDEDAQQEFAIVSAYLGTKHKARPLGKH